MVLLQRDGGIGGEKVGKLLTVIAYVLLGATALYLMLLPGKWIGYYPPPFERPCVDYIGRPICNLPDPTYDWGYWHAGEFGYQRATLSAMLAGDFIRAIPESENE